MQVSGALLAALLLYALFGSQLTEGVTCPHYGVSTSLVMEIILTILLVTVILGTSTQYNVVGPNAAIAVGGTIAFCGLFALPVSSASMNPSLSLGPALVSGSVAQVWIYIVGPFAGSIVAVLISWVIHGGRKPNEKKAAQGKQPAKKQ